MDYRDVRKGVLQAKVVDRNSGLLVFELFFAPPVIAYFISTSEFVSKYKGIDSLVFAGTGLLLFCFLVHRSSKGWVVT